MITIIVTVLVLVYKSFCNTVCICCHPNKASCRCCRCRWKNHITVANCLRTFALIVSTHPYCARKFTCHVIHRERARSTKINNDRADGIAIALPGFNDLGCSVTPTFLFRNRVYLQFSPHCPKMNNKSMWEVKNISLKISVHGTWNPAIFRLQGEWNYGR